MIRSLLGRAKEKINNRKREREKHTCIHALDLTQSCKFHINVQARICKFLDKKPRLLLLLLLQEILHVFLFREKRIHSLLNELS